jgi:predicted metalloprotease
MRAAAAVGDDTLQRSAGRSVVPDAFTHGSSEQRMRWFNTGFDTGSVEACDTFKAADV